MGETCPHCRRPTGTMPSDDPVTYWRTCWERNGNVCLAAAVGYRNGIDEGVRLAKKEIVLEQRGWGAGGMSLDWTDVDAAAAKAKVTR